MRTYADKGTRAKRLSGERGRKRVIAWRNMRFSIQRSTEGADGGGMKVSLERRPSEDISESGFTAPALADREASQALSVPSQYEKHEDAHEGNANCCSDLKTELFLFFSENFTYLLAVFLQIARLSIELIHSI